MTSYPSASPPLGSFNIHFLTDAGDSVPVRTRTTWPRRVATMLLAVAAVAAVVIALSISARPARVPTAAPVPVAPVPGEYRLGPGNQPPPGIVVPLRGNRIVVEPVPGEYRLGPGNQPPPGVKIPLWPARGLSDPVPGEFRVGPGNQPAPGVIVPFD